MRTILATLLTVLLLLPVSAVGEIQTITHTVKQSFGGSQSPDDARISAVAKAKREALEKAGTYIESITVVKNLQVDKDEILALAAGVLKAEVVSQKNYASDDAFGIDVVVKVVVDTSVLEERVKKLLQDRTHLEQLNQARLREKVLLEKIAALERENRKIGNTDQQQASLKQAFRDASQGLTAVDWFDKAYALWDGEKFTLPKEVIEYLNNAIKLDPQIAEAYNNRGVAYSDLGNYKQAMDDINKAIELNPQNAVAYYNRGHDYFKLGNTQQAIKDYNKAIELNPQLAEAYFNRGFAFDKLGNYQQAIKDYSKAIDINPDGYKAYQGRGDVYKSQKQYPKAIEDFNKVIAINPDDYDSYVKRGLVYYQMGLEQVFELAKVGRGNPNEIQSFDTAILDFNKAIFINQSRYNAYGGRGLSYIFKDQPDKAMTDLEKAISLIPKDDTEAMANIYNGRGMLYMFQGNTEKAKSDFQRACKMGDKIACELSEQFSDKK